jgi:hypothetical protein
MQDCCGDQTCSEVPYIWSKREQKDREIFEREKLEALSSVRDEKYLFEVMVQRFKASDGRPGSTDSKDIDTAAEAMRYCESISQDALVGLDAIEHEVNSFEFRSDIPIHSQSEALRNLIDAAVEKGELRAYICPMNEISDEGRLCIDHMEEWNVPKAVISKLRDLLVDKLREAGTNPRPARSALRKIYDEKNSWSGYTTEYEETMRKYAKVLFYVAVATIIFSFLSLHFQIWRIVGLLLAGVAGSSFSVLAKMPVLEVRPSGELDAYERTIFCRLGVGISASVIGCALFVSGVLSIPHLEPSFSEIIGSSSTSPSDRVVLALLAIAMVLGFFERPLTWF